MELILKVKILYIFQLAEKLLELNAFNPLDITYVVNYDFPRNIEEYVHRVGRTGRANRRGTSLSFMTRSDWGSAAELIEILKEAGQEVAQGWSIELFPCHFKSETSRP